MSTFRRLVKWLGPTRLQVLFALLAVTGLLSLILNAARSPDAAWVTPVQSALLFGFLISAALTVASRLGADERRRALVIVGPAALALGLALFFPAFWLLFVPLAIGWMLISFIASQGRVRREYQAAIKHLRKAEYDQAIEVMSELITAEPEIANHRRFRAELYRLAGKGRQARADYEKVAELEPESGVGFNGLAEIYLQDGEFETALDYAQKAYALESDQWVAPYNLGMIEDRLGHTTDSITHLMQALKVGVPDSRHRLLMHLWLARSYVRQGDMSSADAELAAMKREQAGLSEWKTIFESEEAAILRVVLSADVALAERLVNGAETLAALQPQGTA